MIPVCEMPTSRCAHQVVGRAHGGVTGIRSRESDHSVDVFLNVLNESLDNVDLLRTCFNQLLDGVIDLLLILAGVAQLQKLFLFGPLARLGGDVAGFVVDARVLPLDAVSARSRIVIQLRVGPGLAVISLHCVARRLLIICPWVHR